MSGAQCSSAAVITFLSARFMVSGFSNTNLKS
jgi:hypothetical protein